MKMNTANLNEKLLKANGRLIRLRGIVYHVIACKLGDKILADAVPIRATNGIDRLNLVTTRSELGMGLRNLVNLDLFV